MIRAIIIDDEPLAASVIKSYISKHDIELVAECSDGFQGAKAIADHKPDLVFLDVQMPKITGFEMLELLDEIPSIIFTTAFEEYALKAFEADAIDYLLKPFSEERFNDAINKYRAKKGSGSTQVEKIVAKSPLNRVVLRDGGQIRIIALKEVSHFEADDDYVRIVTQDHVYMKKTTLKMYESRLPSELFARIHRSFLVNVAEITKIEPYEKNGHVAVLKSGKKLPVSKSGYQNLKTVLGI